MAFPCSLRLVVIFKKVSTLGCSVSHRPLRDTSFTALSLTAAAAAAVAVPAPISFPLIDLFSQLVMLINSLIFFTATIYNFKAFLKFLRL